MVTIVLDTDYGYSEYALDWGVTDGTIDATAATWIVANSRNANPVQGYGADTGPLPINRYPLQIENAPGLTLLGGTINGEVPLGSDWTYTYRDDYPDGASANSAAIRVDNCNGATIDGWYITQAWDAIRVTGTSDNFIIQNVWISKTRDDAIENDDVLNGTIQNCLFEDVFSGISLGDGGPSGSSNVVTLDNVLLKSKSYLYKEEVTHGSPFKMDKDLAISPNLRILNSVVAIENVNHEGQERLQIAWDKTIESTNNTFLNLSDDAFPVDYPLPGAGWTILSGQTARDHWDTVSTQFKNNFTISPAPAPEPVMGNKLDLTRPVAAKGLGGGEIAALKGLGFTWTKPVVTTPDLTGNLLTSPVAQTDDTPPWDSTGGPATTYANEPIYPGWPGVRVASNGSTWNRLRNESFTPNNANDYIWKIWHKPGTSGEFRIVFADSTTGDFLTFEGPYASPVLDLPETFCTLTLNEHTNNGDHYYTELLATSLSFTGAMIFGFTPNSSTVGEDAVIYAAAVFQV